MQQDRQQDPGAARVARPGTATSEPARSGAARSNPSRSSAVDVGAVLQEARAAVVSATEVLEGVVDEVRERGGGAVEALAGRRRPVRRWPWAVGAAVAGAAAGAAVAVLVRTVLGQDAPGAQEPEQLRAVIDLRPQDVTLPPSS